jgi:hypothetical protein
VNRICIGGVTGKCREVSVIQNACHVVLRDVNLPGVAGPRYLTNNVDRTAERELSQRAAATLARGACLMKFRAEFVCRRAARARLRSAVGF